MRPRVARACITLLPLLLLCGQAAAAPPVEETLTRHNLQGAFSFGEDARLVGDVLWDQGWRVNASGAWPDAPTEALLGPDRFTVTGPRVVAWYAERVVPPGEGLPWDPNARPGEPFLVSGPGVLFYDFDVALRPAPGARYLHLASPLDPTELRAGPGESWSMRTVSAREAFEDSAPRMSPKLSPVPAVEARQIRLEGNAPTLESADVGRITLYGYNVTVRHRMEESHFRTGRWTEDAAPGGQVGLKVEKEAVLVLYPQPGRLRMAASGPVRITAPSIAFDGTFEVPQVRADVLYQENRKVFDSPQWTARGALTLWAREPPTVEAQARPYHVDASGFVWAQESAATSTHPAVPLRWPAATLLAAAAAFVLLFLAAKAALACFSRLARDRVSDHPRRRLLLDAVEANPAVSAPELMATGAMSRSSFDHHVRTLRRHGMLSAFKVQGVWHFAPHGRDLQEARVRAWLKRDEPLRRLLSLVHERRYVPASEALAFLGNHAGLGRSGAWSLIRRCVKGGLLLKERTGRIVTLRGTDLADRFGRP